MRRGIIGDRSPIELGRLIAEETALVEDVYKRQYGYRRMTLWLNNFIGIHVNNKRVRRVMKKAGLQAEIRKKKKFKVMSENIHSYENILNREFRLSLIHI